jgi:hypothetical protein
MMTEGRGPLPERWRRFRRRPPEDRALILRAMLFFPLVRGGLRLFGFRRWKQLLERFFLPASASQPLPPDALREKALRAARVVRSAELHGPFHPNCLERSLTLWWLLRRNGVESELHIGARKEGPCFEAHAWIELGGEILNDAAEVHQHYARFDAPLVAAAGAAAHPATGKVESA